MADQTIYPPPIPRPTEPPQIAFHLTVSMSDAEYHFLAGYTKGLVALDPAPNSPEGCALQLLAFVVDKYEQIRYGPSLGQPQLIDKGPVFQSGAEPTGENMVG